MDLEKNPDDVWIIYSSGVTPSNKVLSGCHPGI